MLRVTDHEKYFDGDTFVFPNAESWYGPILDLPDGGGMFGLWMLTLETWADHPGDGYLTTNGKKDGKPLSAVALSELFGVRIKEHLTTRGDKDSGLSALSLAERCGLSVKNFSQCLKGLTSLGYITDSNQLPLYQIVNYDDHFENNKSRMRDQCSFVCVPNKHGGTGLSNLLSEPDNLSIYGFWMLLLQLCSRQRKPRLGFVTADGTRDGRRLGAAELARTFRTSMGQVCRCLRVLAAPEIGFLGLVDGEPESPKEDDH